jgi:hypothetical protein
MFNSEPAIFRSSSSGRSRLDDPNICDIGLNISEAGASEVEVEVEVEASEFESRAKPQSD